MSITGLKIGFAITGSFCTIDKILIEIEKLINGGAEVYSIGSDTVNSINTRFGTADEMKEKLFNLTGKNIISSIKEAEEIGPTAYLDIMIIAPCTGNTLAKITNGITDTPVTMATKAHLRNQKPVVISISTNDGLGANAKNIGMLINMKNIYFVPFGQDNPTQKPNSLIARTD